MYITTQKYILDYYSQIFYRGRRVFTLAEFLFLEYSSSISLNNSDMQNQDTLGALSKGNIRSQHTSTCVDSDSTSHYYTDMQKSNIDYQRTDSMNLPSGHLISHINHIADTSLPSLTANNHDELTDLHMSLTGGRYLPYQPISRADISSSITSSIDHDNNTQNHINELYHRPKSAFSTVMHRFDSQKPTLTSEASHSDELESYFSSFSTTPIQQSTGYRGTMMSALTLTALMNTSADEMLNSLTTEQLIELEKNVRRLKKRKEQQRLGQKHQRFEFIQKFPSSISTENQQQNILSNDSTLQNTTANDNEGIHTYTNISYSVSRSPQNNAIIAPNSTTKFINTSTQANNVLNLPASQPVTLIKNGVEHLVFTYSTRGNDQEYMIKSNIDSILSEDLPEEFRRENCVYPRACVPIESYIGNRYEYETTVNDIAWRLTWLNRDLLIGRRGLIQRAVDSYRNRFQESRSRRVVRQEKINNGTLRRRTVGDSNQTSQLVSHLPNSETIINNSYSHGNNVCSIEPSGTKQTDVDFENYIIVYFEDLSNSSGNNRDANIKCLKLRADIDQVNLAELNDTFKLRNCLYPEALDSSLYNRNEELYCYESELNEVGWKLAFLNATKLAGRRDLLFSAVDAFRTERHSKNYSSYSYEKEEKIMNRQLNRTFHNERHTLLTESGYNIHSQNVAYSS